MKKLSVIILFTLFSLLLASAAFSAPPPLDEPTAKPALTSEFVAAAARQMKNVFLDFDSAHEKLHRASGRDVIETLMSQLRATPIKDPKTLSYPSGNDPEGQRLTTIYNSLWRVDSQLRPAALRLASAIDLAFLPERFHRFTLAFDYLNDETSVHSALKDFNSVFEACLETIRTMDRNDVPNFTPDEVLIHSNMNVFFTVKGTRKGSFDRTLRAIDRYLETLSPVYVKQFAEDLNAVEAALKELQQNVNGVNAWLASRQWNEDPISVAAGYELFGMRIDQLIKDGRALIDKINSGTKCAQIRAGTFISGGMMDLSGIAGAEEGLPQYRSRTYATFRLCRDNYNAAAASVYERHKNESGVKLKRW